MFWVYCGLLPEDNLHAGAIVSTSQQIPSPPARVCLLEKLREFFFTAMSWLKTRSARTFCCLVLLVISFTSLYLRHLATLSPAKNLPVASEGEQRQIINLAKALKLRIRQLTTLVPVDNPPVASEGEQRRIINVDDTLKFGQLTTHVPVDNPPVASKGEQRQSINVDDTLNFGARPQVATRTSWNAPIIWEGMFDPNLYDQQHIERNSTVALTVFAVGRYLDAYLKTFLTTAEQHFMLGLQVTYYVFTDQPEKVPNIDLGPKRSLKVMSVEKHSRWQDISMMRMKTISDTIESEIRHHCRYVFCFDVDQVFKGRFGSEALGDSVALLHAWFYKLPKNRFTYDRNPKSKAFMETGDYYYHAAVFGGLWENVKNLADFCFLGIMEDKGNNVEALWHDESHLNKYFWLHKPSRLLSPEYCWDQIIGKNTDIRVQRLIWAPKQYNKLRTR